MSKEQDKEKPLSNHIKYLYGKLFQDESILVYEVKQIHSVCSVCLYKLLLYIPVLNKCGCCKGFHCCKLTLKIIKAA